MEFIIRCTILVLSWLVIICESYVPKDPRIIADLSKSFGLVAVIIVLLTMVIIIIVLLFKIHKLKSGQRNTPRSLENGKGCYRSLSSQNSAVNSNQPPADDVIPSEDDNHFDLLQSLRIKKNQVENLKLLENGTIYTLQKGQLKSVNNPVNVLDIMVKSALDQNDFEHHRLIKIELKTLCDIEAHQTLLAHLGFIEDKGNLSIVFEYPEGGNLLEYIRTFQGHRGFIKTLKGCLGGNGFKNQLSLSRCGYNVYKPVLDNNLLSLCTFDLLSFAYQIAVGMKHLATNHSGYSYYHRQLCLSNIFITRNKTIRIGNFSLTRSSHNNEYYRSVTSWDFPKSHQAPETVDDKRFTEKSDVWSYAVCLYELFSLGKVPYEGEEDALKFASCGGRLKMPDYCHPEIYTFMRRCWSVSPIDRPIFSNCVHFFEQHLQRFSVQILGQITDKLRESAEHQGNLADWIDYNGKK